MLRDELVAIKKKFGTPRRTTILEGEFEQDEEELIKREEMVVTVTHTGYIKRVPLSTYRAQRRGGKGRAGMSTREEDFVTRVFVVNTHTPVLFFSTTGKVYKLKAYALPLGTPQARGKAMVNVLPLAEGETIATLMPLPEDEGGVGRARRGICDHPRNRPAYPAQQVQQRAVDWNHCHQAGGRRPADRRCHCH